MNEDKLECCLAKSCKAEHDLCNDKKYTEKLYRIGKLFGGDCLCLWCAFHLQDLIKPTLTEYDVEAMENLKKKFAGYWKLIEEEGIDKVRFELGMQWLEAEPDNVPSKLQYPPPEVTVGGTRVRR